MKFVFYSEVPPDELGYFGDVVIKAANHSEAYQCLINMLYEEQYETANLDRIQSELWED